MKKNMKIILFFLFLSLVALLSFSVQEKKTKESLADQKLNQFKNTSSINLSNFNDEDIPEEARDSVKNIIEREIKSKSKKININKISNDGLSLLHEAVIEECDSCVERLLDMGADPKVVSKKGASILSMAVSNGNEKLSERFLKLGLDPNLVSNKANYTMLMDASFEGNFSIVKLLIDNNADINTLDTDGMSALAYAAKAGSVKVVNYLLQNGAKDSFEDNRGMKALDHAKRYEHKEIVKILSK